MILWADAYRFVEQLLEADYRLREQEAFGYPTFQLYAPLNGLEPLLRRFAAVSPQDLGLSSCAHKPADCEPLLPFKATTPELVRAVMLLAASAGLPDDLEITQHDSKGTEFTACVEAEDSSGTTVELQLFILPPEGLSLAEAGLLDSTVQIVQRLADMAH